MAFAQRALKFTFAGYEPGVLNVSGLRATASIQTFSGPIGVTAQAKIWGLTMAQMSAYSSSISSAVGASGYTLTIEAGEMGGQMSAVLIESPIWQSWPDMSGAPESAFAVVCSGVGRGAEMIASVSQPGTANAEDLIAGICAGNGLTLHNNGAHAVLRNQMTHGSAITQIDTIAHAAKFVYRIEGPDVWIWPPNGKPDEAIIDVGPSLGMVGYPQFYPTGIIVTTLLDTQLRVGRYINVKGSSITKANGQWKVIHVEHELSTMLREGPWFTTVLASAPDSSLLSNPAAYA